MAHDDQMQALVESVNDWRGVAVLADPAAQVRGTAWRVYLEVDPMEGGYSSLSEMLWALRETDVVTTVHYESPWTHGDFALAYCLHGKGELTLTRRPHSWTSTDSSTTKCVARR
jgi:hypothetical protein